MAAAGRGGGGGGAGRGYSKLAICTLFKTKTYNFLYPFSDLGEKSIPYSDLKISKRL